MATISTTDLAHRLRPAIVRLSRRMRQEAGEELSPSQNAALTTIDCHGPLTPSEVAARERIQRPTATRILSRLEEAGLIARTPDPADRRSSLLAATPAGSALLAERRARRDAWMATRLDTLSPEDLATLDRAAGILERLLDEGDGSPGGLASLGAIARGAILPRNKGQS
jgi:DNA-binding MarR family transcriptional regulator